ncbi:TetM/TetW/TetO/TetS family tetracycline resistance ribosomal protection protein [Microlunatus elymi]|uniref:TetM/TetW/TetO/TetS family tetracycline resistance ribosomal protection protein n=1 Tax=Microlunatus elymi TaxID=2596828 RepID=A0A516Q2G2_9ACTN|nr:TetM/TetW/TetO/TetS family tetracycline resistance ribosomal protection protein [Microlunatus elymi]QDP97620.1 TetM/TetW/TetO/TetS family tetracycline resistance ribosomal protection protein [Microlunatus elymi]
MPPAPVRFLNLGILAHVDAGKTTLTEQLLYLGGAIDEPGSVDSGTTRADTLALERRRGITIKSAAVSFALADRMINVVDTPGHPDFIAEVERVLGILDGAILVISAVEGVQPQTRIIMGALQRLGVPTLLFVNKIDRMGADLERVIGQIRARLTPDVLPMGRVLSAGSRASSFATYRTNDPAFAERATTTLAEHDDGVLAAYVDGTVLSESDLTADVAAQTRAGVLHPIFAGSALTGAGVGELLGSLTTLLPTAAGAIDAPISARVFKVERGPEGGKIAYLRMNEGTLRPRQRLELSGGRSGKVSAVETYGSHGWGPADRLVPGEIGRVYGLAAVRVGDAVGDLAVQTEPHFPPPTLEAAVEARRPEDGPALRTALVQLADQDPLINVHVDAAGHPTVSLYGRVQQEVLQATLADEYGVDARFADAAVLHIERPRTVATAVERLNTPSNPYQATIGLRIEPGEPGSGVRFAVAAPALDMPLYLYGDVERFASAIERHVRDALARGHYGWAVTDCIVTLVETAYSVADGPPSKRGPTSTSRDYRKVTPVVCRQALRLAGTQVCEPVLRISLEVPESDAAALQTVLGRMRAQPIGQWQVGMMARIEARLVAARLHELQHQLPDLTGGEGILQYQFDAYQPVSGRPPVRARQRDSELPEESLT